MPTINRMTCQTSGQYVGAPDSSASQVAAASIHGREEQRHGPIAPA